MSGTKILWLQVVIVFGIVILAIWAATEWTAWQLGFQPELGVPWWHLAGAPIYLPPGFFWWWFAYDAYAPNVFLHGAYIAASGTVVAIIAAIAMSVWRAREAKRVITYGSARWATREEARAAGLLAPDGVLLGKLGRDYLRHDGPKHVLCFAPTVIFVRPDGDIADNLGPTFKGWLQPLLKRTDLQLPGAPPGSRGWQKVFVLRKPEIEVPVWVQTLDRSTKKTLKPPQKFVDLRQLLASVGKKVFDLHFWEMLAHVHGQGRAIAASG